VAFVTALILGIDPDLHGALALINRDTGVLVDVLDVPLLELKGKSELDVSQLAATLDDLAKSIGEAWIEKAGPRPVQGVIGAFGTGYHYGVLVGLVRAQFIRLTAVAPATWKRAMRVTSDKDEARKEASLMFPAECRRWGLKKHHGRAEAALIAAYGRRQVLREAA
jgi:crossover junction endodeoxyribonuclease RuvC